AGAKREGGITVSFAPRGSTADAVIMKTLRRAANPRRLTVVSSDNAVRSAARAEGAQVVSAQEFAVRLIARPRKRGGIRQGDKPELNAADVDYWLERFKQRR
ncbi:MAG: NYN domain-containing protein, partial [Chloroflexi bacterium]|nr:NYN domain-containing protein [Chloroflexota bacterium]